MSRLIIVIIIIISVLFSASIIIREKIPFWENLYKVFQINDDLDWKKRLCVYFRLLGITYITYLATSRFI